MINKEDLRDCEPSQFRPGLSEAEIMQLLQEAAQQYEEYMRLADLTGISAEDEDEVYCPKYDWDNPIGIGIKEPLDGKLV